MNDFKDYRDYVGTRSEKFFKDTLFQGDHLMIGINCLDPGQTRRRSTGGEAVMSRLLRTR